MAAGGILFLDLATTVGWADGSPGGRVQSGVVRLGDPGASSAERYDKLFIWLWERTAAFKPAAIYFEAPLPPSHVRGHTNVDTAMFLMGLPAIVELLAQRRGIWTVRKVNVQDVRHFFIGGRGFVFGGQALTGRRNLPSKQAKFCVSERCRELGYEPKTHDEADAIAGLLYVLSLRSPGEAWAATPLAEGAAA